LKPQDFTIFGVIEQLASSIGWRVMAIYGKGTIVASAGITGYFVLIFTKSANPTMFLFLFIK